MLEDSNKQINSRQADETNKLDTNIVNNDVSSILGSENINKYNHTFSVKLCKQKLSKLLEESNGGKLKSGTKSIIVDLVTNREEFSKLKFESDNNNFLIDLKNNTQAQSDWYNDTLNKLYKLVKDEDKLSVADNPGWFSIKSNFKENRELLNHKIYLTIPVSGYGFIQHLLDLAKKLEQIGSESNDSISVKIPYNLLGFLTHNDSVVIHFKNKENREGVEKIIKEWENENNINEGNRHLGRTKFAIDSKETSFSNLVAENIEKWLVENYTKYDNEVLVNEAIKHAIEQGQKIPVIKNK